MVRIVVSDEQAKVIRETKTLVEVFDRWGNSLGFLTPAVSVDEIAVAKARREFDEPRYTTQQVLDHLTTLKPE